MGKPRLGKMEFSSIAFAQLWTAEVSGRMKLKLGELRVSIVYFD